MMKKFNNIKIFDDSNAMKSRGLEKSYVYDTLIENSKEILLRRVDGKAIGVLGDITKVTPHKIYANLWITDAMITPQTNYFLAGYIKTSRQGNDAFDILLRPEPLSFLSKLKVLFHR